MKLLVITTPPDPHLDLVRRHLPKDVTIVIFDPLRIARDEELSYSFFRDSLEVRLKDDVISDATIIWFRKPRMADLASMPVASHLKSFAFDAYRQSIVWLYSVMDNALWVSDYWKIKKAESKAYQLTCAKNVGLDIPKTLITNSQKQAKLFLKKTPKVVAKPLNVSFVRFGQTLSASFTTRVSSMQDCSFDGLHCAPAIFQEEMIGEDVRVTVIGDQFFPARIKKLRATADEVDWRWGNFDDSLEVIEDSHFPDSIGRMCVEMIKSMGLKFGAFDFKCDNERNRYWFLEVNPNGQWAFVELMSNLPISNAFASFFLTAGR